MNKKPILKNWQLNTHQKETNKKSARFGFWSNWILNAVILLKTYEKNESKNKRHLIMADVNDFAHSKIADNF